jgi:hypothetical protein
MLTKKERAELRAHIAVLVAQGMGAEDIARAVHRRFDTIRPLVIEAQQAQNQTKKENATHG